MADIKVTRKIIHFLTTRLPLSEETLNTVFHEAEIIPSSKKVLKHIEWLLLALGAGFFMTGVIFFFAYNWNDLGKYAKLLLVGGGLITVYVVTFLRKENDIIYKILHICGGILVGVLFAVYGQIYQTGANAYDLFLNWTIMISVWVFISRFQAYWLLYVILINITLIYYDDQIRDTHDFYLPSFIALLNLAVVLLWEFVLKRWSDDGLRWFPRVVAAGIFLPLTIVSSDAFIEDFEHEGHLIGLILTFLTCTTLGFIYYSRIKDLFFLSLIAISGIIISSCFFMKLFGYHDESSFFFTSGCVMSLTIAATYFLIRVHKKWKTENNVTDAAA